jgi:arginyl-tRNA synthetase
MISADIKQFIQKTLAISFAPSLDVPSVKEFGHYSTNVAMRLAKEYKKNPLEVAQEFAAKLKSADKKGIFERIEAVKPGFINFWLSKEFLQKELAGIAKKPKDIGVGKIGKGKKVIIDHASTNIAKPLHVGHLRTTVIGAALANMHEALGYKVVRWNYIGDWGTQFGKLVAAYKLWGDKKRVEADPIGEMLALYVKFHDELKTNPELEKQGQEEFKKLEQGDKEARKLWSWFVDESLIEFEKIFSILNVRFDTNKGESAYEKELPKIVATLKKDKVAVQSEGAWIIPLEKFNLPPALVAKSDGATLYLTRDIASLKDRLKMKPVKILYVVANQQALHFEQLFAVANLLGLNTAELTHVKFGMVLGEDGKKLATREGKAIQLMDVLDEGMKRAYMVVSEKNPNLSDDEKTKVARAVSIGALKYNDLKENRNSDIQFNWEKMLDLTGDTAPYLQYTYTRFMSIVAKAKKIGKADMVTLDGELEALIMKKVLDFTDVIAQCAETYYTSYMAKYLFELAKLGSQYYEVTPILIDENVARRNARLMLIHTVALTLRKGLGLLGIETTERI